MDNLIHTISITGGLKTESEIRMSYHDLFSVYNKLVFV